jgi:hypothetical protein
MPQRMATPAQRDYIVVLAQKAGFHDDETAIKEITGHSFSNIQRKGVTFDEAGHIIDTLKERAGEGSV